MTQQTTQPHCHVNTEDFALLPSTLPIGGRRRKKCRRHVSQNIAHARILHEASKGGAVAAFYRRMDLLGCNNSYRNCIFLDPHGHVAVACDTAGRMDVVQLPRYCHGNSESRQMGILLAGKLSIGHSESTESFHLKSIHQGNAFCVGMPNGEFGIFATERASNLCQQYGLSEKSATMYQETPKSVFVKTAWSIPRPAIQYHCRSDTNVGLTPLESLDSTRTWMGRRPWPEHPQLEDWDVSYPRKRDCNDNLHRWSFLETSSAILAAHVASDQDGITLQVMDSRLRQQHRKSAIRIDVSSGIRGAEYNDEVSSVCWLAENLLLTSHVRYSGDDNVLKLWDVRKTGAVADHTIISCPCDPDLATPRTIHDKIPNTQRKPRVSRLLSSENAAGTVLVTLEKHSEFMTSREHQLIDLSTWNCIQRIQEADFKSTTEPYLVDAVTPCLDCVATCQSQTISFYNLYQETLSTPKRKAPSRGKKRSADGNETISESTKGKFTPKLVDGNSLPTRLSCMTMNASGTTLMGGSLDGDLFVWSGG